MTAEKYEISGCFYKDGFKQTFSKEVSAESEKRALEKMYSIIGSNHRVKRREIKDIEVKELNE